jgi:class 3 adenylate cyclase/tetratricopeptide (TPR) repeat protein
MMVLAASPERAIISILAVDTVDSTGHIAGHDPDDAQDLLDRIFRRLSSVVENAGGLFVSYAGDGGLAVFGWPDSQEDHADRACEAAWRIQVSKASSLCGLQGRPIQFRIGIHSGLVGLRQTSIAGVARPDLVGGTVHLAAALQKHAPPGGVLVSSDAVQLCRSELALTPSDHPALAGFNIAAYVLSGQPVRRNDISPHSRYQHPMIGRVSERELLRKALIHEGGENCTIGIIGEPGIGKSRLVEALMQDARYAGVRILAFYGDSQKSTTPYAAVRPLILAALSLEDNADDEDIVAALEKAGITDRPSGPLAAILLSKRADKGTAAVTQTQVARNIIEIFKSLAAQEPVLLVIEDLQLLDPESIHWLRLLSREPDLGSRKLVVTGRPESISQVEGIARTVLQLAPLPRNEMQELIKQRSPLGTLPPSMVETILERSDGIPFVLEQMMLSIGVDGVKDLDLLPQSVQSVIHARLNRLTPQVKSCAQALSVIGENVNIDFALRALDLDRAALRRARDELQRLEIADSAAGDSIRFRHAIVREACLATVPGPRRQKIHRSAIEAITSMHANLDAQYERLAFHAEGARDDESTLKYLWLAAMRARRSSASGSLEFIFRRAIQCIDRIGEAAEPQFVDFVLMAFDPLQQLGQFRRMNVLLSRAMALAQKQGHSDKVCATLCHMSMVSWFEGRYSEGLEQAEEALAIATEVKNLPLIFSAKFMLASVLHGMGQMDRAISLQRELCTTLSGKLERARLGAAGIPGSIVRSFLCWFLMEVGGYDEGIIHVTRALQIAEEEHEPYSEMLARLGMGRNLTKLKRNREAVECLQIAIALIERNGYDAALPHIIGLLATALARSGGGERATRMVEDWLASGQEERTGRLELYYLNAGYAEALFSLGRIEQSFVAIDAALAIAREIANPCLMVQGLGLRARFRHQSSRDASEADRDLAEVSELCRRHGLVAEDLA